MNKAKHRKLIGLAAVIITAVSLNAHSDAFKPDFVDTLVAPYLEIQESLAGDDLDSAKSAARDFVDATKEAPETAPSEEVKGLAGPAGSIASASDMDSARKAFEDLSIEMTSLVEHIGTTGDTPLYLAYCPMAFGGKGAAWIQDDQSVLNPYYGAKMLKCGSVQKQLAGGEDKSAHHESGSGHEHMGHGHGMMDNPQHSMSPEDMAAIHAGVPGYHAAHMSARSESTSGSACGMSCCAKKSGS